MQSQITNTLKATVISSFLFFPGGSEVKASASNVGDLGSIPESGRSPGVGNGNPFQYSCLGSSMCRDAWQATVHGIIRVRHNLVTKPPSPLEIIDKILMQEQSGED